MFAQGNGSQGVPNRPRGAVRVLCCILNCQNNGYDQILRLKFLYHARHLQRTSSTSIKSNAIEKLVLHVSKHLNSTVVTVLFSMNLSKVRKCLFWTVHQLKGRSESLKIRGTWELNDWIHLRQQQARLQHNRFRFRRCRLECFTTENGFRIKKRILWMMRSFEK